MREQICDFRSTSTYQTWSTEIYYKAESRELIGAKMQIRTLSGMDFHDITKEQAAALGEKIGPMLAYLGRLRDRINQERFSPDDEIRLAVDDAYNAIHRLRMRVHYQTCRESTGGKR